MKTTTTTTNQFQILSIASLLLGTFLMVSPRAQAANDEGELALSLERIGRIHNYVPSTTAPALNILDQRVNSPKSVRFNADGTKIYVNSLEGGETLVYSWPELKRLRVISHNFTKAHAELFGGESTVFDYPYYSKSSSGDPNIFIGKPVESELSHNGRWLWIPYYRRGFDPSGQSPSAVAIVDTTTDKIVRVMPTGPIPKYVAASPDGRTVAITHWGDNTIGLIDTSSGDPRDFRYIDHLVVENKMSQDGLQGTDRDATCGFCLRGTVFTPDSRYLFVARMGKGGLAAFDLEKRTYMGTLFNIKSTPRHLVVSPDGEYLYVSSNVYGYVSKLPIKTVIAAFEGARGRGIQGPNWQAVFVGKGARTLAISSDGRVLFAAVNDDSSLVAIDAASMKVLTSLPLDHYPVGLAVSPDDSFVVLTSQGKTLRDASGALVHDGGNVVNIIKVNYGPAYRSTAPAPLR